MEEKTVFGLGLNEVLIVLLIVVIVFGGKRLPELARGLGRGIVDFKSALREKPTDESEKAETETDKESSN